MYDKNKTKHMNANLFLYRSHTSLVFPLYKEFMFSARIKMEASIFLNVSKAFSNFFNKRPSTINAPLKTLIIK